LKRTGCLQLLIALVALSLSLGVPSFAAEGPVTVMIPATFLTDSWEEARELFTVKTGIEVEVVSVTDWNEMMQKVPVMVAGGVAPDAVYHDSGVQADLVANGSVRPVDDFIARSKLDLSLWPAPVVRGYEYKGKMYSLPTGISNFTMYYNADRLEAAGVGALPTDWDHPTAFTFDDMVSAARKVTIDRDGDGTPEQYGLQDFFTSGAQGLNMWRLDYINDEQTAFVAASQAHVDAITQMRSLWQEHRVVGGNFLNGTAVMLPIQPYYLNSLYNAMRWKIASICDTAAPATPALRKRATNCCGVLSRKDRKGHEPNHAFTSKIIRPLLPVLIQTLPAAACPDPPATALRCPRR
jgi:ABC-type glycerol-3-phosphate transport system substrate-binding protein